MYFIRLCAFWAGGLERVKVNPPGTIPGGWTSSAAEDISAETDMLQQVIQTEQITTLAKLISALPEYEHEIRSVYAISVD